MGKESKLWDDSSLIDAFDNAMSKYKMHGLKSREANVSFSVHQSGDGAIKPRDVGENNNAGVITGTETEEAKDLEPVKENCAVKLQTPEPYIDTTTSLPMQDKQDGNNGYSDLQGAQEYNQLLSQYYEVEEKRQTILQQLQQCGSWDYQYSAEGYSTAAPWGTSCVYQQYPIRTSQASQSTVICSCCPYVCQSLVTPCTQYPCCPLAGTSVGKINAEPNGAITCENLPTVIDSDIVKTAMGAAERAISSLTTQASINQNENEENKEKKDGEEETNHGNCVTDLSVLLNAWYSAGFYTGKYLVEHSIAKKRQ
ncbi:uncharacterized protein LOC120193540 isoform X2 [Hibiscus syriacus]|uniref:uncharacterized protein LOC120193540 isoform X2 n=1 Tax=Hibiscus syriacus TaxID=106335 RepID=UPI00192324F5|nr:uncharacterized protein LOC120193540 isoform X2 [Hibiscus syriacus]